MLQRARQLKISLAAKCQLLFGAAVLMIIGATLFVPGHRIEQLTEQLNERAAGALAEHILAEHIAGARNHDSVRQIRPTTTPATAPSEDTTSRAATTEPPVMRIISLEASRDASPSDPGRFDQRAIGHFLRNADAMTYAAYVDRGEAGKGYRYAQPIYYTEQSCGRCHTPVLFRRAGLSATVPSSRPSTEPSIASAIAAAEDTPANLLPLPVGPEPRRLAGLVRVDVRSRIDTSELFLNRAFLLMAGGLAGFLAIVTFYFITTRLILQPVRVLQETAEKVSQGDLNIRSDIATGDEFQVLSETFNRMLANLKENADQLRAVNKGLDLRLGQLAETNVGLYESNRLKSEFLANVSHELRTPLNSILGFAELLKDAIDAGPDAKSTRYLGNILRSGRMLLDLINDLLDLAKIEAGRMEIRSEHLSLGDLFEALSSLLKPLVEPKRVQIVPSVGRDVPILQTDPGKLQQVLYNFLSNAIKFSPEKGSIELSATLEDADHVRIAVTDHGPGIAQDKHSVIFEKFRQIDGSVTRTHGGTGLGLAISRELTQLMGGTIGVESQVGQGATFWITLPLKTQAGQADVRGRMVMAG